MGEMIDGSMDHNDTAMRDKQTVSSGEVGTDVEGVMANGTYGPQNLPVFDVEPHEFYQNSEYGRRRMRFSSGSNVQKYMQGTQYTIPFYIRVTDKDGKQYIRKVK